MKIKALWFEPNLGLCGYICALQEKRGKHYKLITKIYKNI